MLTHSNRRIMIKSFIKLALLWCSSILQHNRKSKILFYHDIYKTINYKATDDDVCMGTHLDMFKRHLEVIHKEGYTIVPRITEPEGQVCIMLDDGFRGIYECRQFFYDNQIYPTIFLAVELIGQEGILTKEEILELQAHGFIFECHSWSHKDLTIWNDEDLMRELGESKKYLSEMLNKVVSEICLPIGYFNDHLLEQLKVYGYDKVYSSIPGNYWESKVGGMIARNLVQFASPTEVRLVLRGGNEMIKGRYQNLHYKVR